MITKDDNMPGLRICDQATTPGSSAGIHSVRSKFGRSNLKAAGYSTRRGSDVNLDKLHTVMSGGGEIGQLKSRGARGRHRDRLGIGMACRPNSCFDDNMGV